MQKSHSERGDRPSTPEFILQVSNSDDDKGEHNSSENENDP